MRRLLTILATVVPLTAFATPPDFSKGGLIFSIQGGYGMWGINEAKLASMLDRSQYAPAPVGDTYAQQFTQGTLKDTAALSLRLGYNILGHATLEVDFTGTGWSPFDDNRGGAGFLAGVLHWHPAQIFFSDSERPFDVSIFGGAGYGIAGGPSSPGGQAYGMDGLALEFGAEGDYYFAPGFALSVFARWVVLDWSNFYLNYDQRSQPGNTLPVSGPIGDFFTIGAALTFRFIPG